MAGTRLSSRDRRALFIGALVLAPALVVSLGIRPYLAALGTTHEQTQRERDLLQREVALLADLPRYPAQVRQAEHALLRQAPRLFSGGDLGSASAALANHVGAVAVTQRVFIQRSETRPPETVAEGIAKVRVELQAMSDLEGLLGFFHALETGPKLLTVERVVIAPAERLNRGPGREEEVLSLAATVAGYALEEQP